MEVDVQYACEDAGVPDTATIQQWVTLAAEQSGRLTGEATEVAVRVVGEAEIQTLNQLYRNKDATTNVLSFPSGAVAGLPPTAPQQLGDVVVCAAVIRDEALRQQKPLADHWAHMLVHGTLHLLGYDHGADAEAEVMERLETRILAAEGIADPYVSRL